ncbi:hypothetical protein EIP86_003165 [Pleurotus ostreatoroseus]|nr:hypothetical protein EIP86_003165 [Pleurotus ostreatoroseus]
MVSFSKPSPPLSPTPARTASIREGKKAQKVKKEEDVPATPTSSPARSHTPIPPLMPLVETTEASEDEGAEDKFLDVQINALADSFETMGMQWVHFYDDVVQFGDPQHDNSSHFPPPPPEPPAIVAPPLTPPPPVPTVLPPAVAYVPRPRPRTLQPGETPPPVYVHDGIPPILLEWLHGLRTGKIYVVIRGFFIGIFENWLTASQYVTNCPGNSHKSFKGDEADDAWDHWVENCLSGAVRGTVSHLSLVGIALPGSSAAAHAHPAVAYVPPVAAPFQPAFAHAQPAVAPTQPAVAPSHGPHAAAAFNGQHAYYSSQNPAAYNAQPISAPFVPVGSPWMGPVSAAQPSLAYQGPLMAFYPQGTLFVTQPGAPMAAPPFAGANVAGAFHAQGVTSPGSSRSSSTSHASTSCSRRGRQHPASGSSGAAGPSGSGATS